MTKAKAPPLLSLRAYAAHRGVSHQAVSQAIADKRLSKSVVLDAKGSPKIKSAALADREWVDNTDQSKPRNAVTGQPKRQRSDDAEPYSPSDAGASAGGDVAGPTYARSRAIREAYQARLLKLEYEEKSGKMLDAERTYSAMFAAWREGRDLMLSLPERTCNRLVGKTAREIYDILNKEVRRALEAAAKAGGEGGVSGG